MLRPACSEVLVYSGEGAGTRSVDSAIQTLKSTLRSTTSPSLDTARVHVGDLSTQQLLDGSWRQRCRMLVMPGGADLPYKRHLDGRGNALIRGFVEEGGSYLGLCAGAYYASSRVEFEVGTRLEVVGDRELRFTSAVARGAVHPGFDYRSEAGAHAALLRFVSPHSRTSAGLRSGHADKLDSSSGAVGNSMASVAIGRRGTAGAVDLASECFDYSNGGPAWDVDGSDANTIVLARYAHTGTAAALVTRVGRGRAVLCGTHPELQADHLKAACVPANLVSAGVCGPEQAVQQAAATIVVCKRLSAHQTQRMQFWRLLLTAAGLGGHLMVDSDTDVLSVHQAPKAITDVVK